MQAWEFAIAYHHETKHHFHRFARSPGYMDWASQPDPFRRFNGAPRTWLPFWDPEDSPRYEDIYEQGAVPPRPVDLRSIAALFEYALGLSAWKEYRETRWALRCNPSSGNLHPTEGYLVAGAVAGLSDRPAVYHYAPRDHALERRTEFDEMTWRALMAGFPANAFLVGLTSIHWREAWKYGERAYRYCQHDVGHAIAAIRLSAATLGWRVRLLEGLSDMNVSLLQGIASREEVPDVEREHPDLVLVAWPADRAADSASPPRTLPSDAVERIGQGPWIGRANRLSETHVDWRLIDAAADACVKPLTPDAPSADAPSPPTPSTMEARTRENLKEDPVKNSPAASNAKDSPTSSKAPPDAQAFPSVSGVIARSRRDEASARRLIHQRRSAVALDGKTWIERDAFYTILQRAMPRAERAPWDVTLMAPEIHLGLFVHRVVGLAPGVYFLIRNARDASRLRRIMRDDFEWAKPPGRPEGLPLFRLLQAPCQRDATLLSCRQSIAGDGCFSLGMIARFAPAIREHGAWYYRRLFWEAGMVGQVLYLEAEAAGIRGTGIGCYFDDPVHDVFGFKDDEFQSLYHFTMGGPVEDARLTTLPAYDAERRRATAPSS